MRNRSIVSRSRSFTQVPRAHNRDHATLPCPSEAYVILVAGADGQLCASGSKAFSYTLPISAATATLKGPIGLAGSCPKSITLGGSCKVLCKDPRNTERVMLTETRLVSAPAQDWSSVATSDMPVFCQWDLRQVADLKATAENFECDFVLRTVCCADVAERMAAPTAAEVELNPAVGSKAVKPAAASAEGVAVSGLEEIVVKVSGVDAASWAAATA